MSSLVNAMRAVSLSQAVDTEKRDNDGFRYEERVIALVFLRCIRKGLPDFEVTSENSNWDKFNDVVATWGRNRDTLLVQLKHKTSKNWKNIKYGDLFSSGDNKPDFNIRKYEASFRSIKGDLRGRKYTLVLASNLSLHDNAVNYFRERETNSVLGAQLLATGGSVHVLGPEAGEFDRDFKQHFFLFCGQKDVNGIRDDICEELKALLRSSDTSTDSACEELCKCVMKWKDDGCKNPVSLTSSWHEWKVIEERYKSGFCSIS